VTIYVPYGAGGLGDVILRLYSQKLAPRLGQQLVLENRPGAGGGVAAKAALANPRDGYSLFFCGSGMAISMSLLKTKPFDILQDFTQISTISSLDELLFATGAQAPFSSVQDVVAMARKAPGKLTFGSINPGSTQNLTAHLVKQRAGIDVVIVPYKAVPDLITALIRGDVDVGVDYFAGFQPVAGDTRIKIIATTGVRRSPLLPLVPTIKESGYPDFVVKSWQGLAAPRGVPDDVLKLTQPRDGRSGHRPRVSRMAGEIRNVARRKHSGSSEHGNGAGGQEMGRGDPESGARPAMMFRVGTPGNFSA